MVHRASIANDVTLQLEIGDVDSRRMVTASRRPPTEKATHSRRKTAVGRNRLRLQRTASCWLRSDARAELARAGDDES